MKARTKSRIAFGLALALLLCGAGVLLLLQAWRSAANTPPSPGADASVAAEEDPQSPFPEVDWDYWQGVNPDVIGWITVPGTTINSPIVQALSLIHI